MSLSPVTFRTHLFQAASATEALESWCRRHWHVQASLTTLVKAVAAPAASEHDLPSALTGGSQPHYRRADLLYNGHVVSEAEMWYLAEALSPAMQAQLHQADTPFGRVIETLGAQREILRSGEDASLSGPLARGFSDSNAFFLHLHLVLRTAEGRVFAEVREHYRHCLLTGPR